MKKQDLYSDSTTAITNIEVMSKAVCHYESIGYSLVDYEFIRGAKDYLRLFFVKP